MRYIKGFALSGGVAVAIFVWSASARAADIFVTAGQDSIQAAIGVASPGDTIHVGAGTWTESIQWSGIPLTITGAGAGQTIIDAQGAGSCLTVGGLTGPCRIEGITFRNGFADMGGAILCSTDNLTVADCELAGNWASQFGGAIAITGGSPRIERCRFTDNHAFGFPGIGGAICSMDASATVVDCAFAGNIASQAGGAMASLGGADTMIGSSLDANTAMLGGGIAHLGGASRAVNCIFNENVASAVGGAAYCSGSQSLLLNCAFWKNSASSHGGGVAFDAGSDGLVLNSSFAYNDSVGSGQAVAAVGGSSRVVNSILWYDGLSETFAQFPATLAVSSSNVMGLMNTAYANISADPQYLDAPNGDLRVQAGSPGIDKGIADPALSGSATDLAGNPRILGDAVDMGAYETNVQIDPSALVLALKQAVCALVRGGANLPAQGGALQAKLTAALSAIQTGDSAGARSAVQDFENQVRAFIKTGRLTKAQGQPLLDSADVILAALGG